MTWWGKLIGTGVGMFGGPIGALVGAAFGHAYDKDNPEVTDEKKARVLYLAYFFSCLAKVAKADGPAHPVVEIPTGVLDVDEFDASARCQ